MSDIGELIARLEALDGPDTVLDEAIQAWSAGATIEWQEYKKANAYHRDGFWVSIGTVLPYTASLDAVVGLAKQLGFGISLVTDPPSARVWSLPWADHDYHTRDIIEASNPAIAGCIALLRALPEKEPR